MAFDKEYNEIIAKQQALSMNVIANDRVIRTKRQLRCCLCGNEGKVLYKALDDKLYGAPDLWDLKKCQNSDCGLIWLDPMPQIVDLPKLYENYYTHVDPSNNDSKTRTLYQKIVNSYLRSQYGYLNCAESNIFGKLIFLHPERRAGIDCSIMGLSYQKGANLLDVGFGDGTRLQHLASLGWSVEGIDFDPAAVENARAKGIKVSQGDIFSQKYPDEYFDVVVSNHVIEHVPEPVAFFQECHRILKKGGKIVHYTPNTDSYGHSKYKNDWRGLEPPRHLYLFSPASLTRAVSKAGFDSVRCDSSGRGANILLDSYYLKRYGALDSGKPSLGKRLLFEYFAVKEFIILNINKKRGEELVVHATK